ncbi:uncharacterized protein LOC116304716 [Actinia tenebrosa]|uniref:Uncharacterized protein LOC116304716 n=1 Tax=Actinia tenebrosa TaxID=6105 RepID=A0A6P8ITL4_ACTTE|nr:uncharacterized protein LOC116304716 [Actinia tenebrosa]
MSDNIEASRTRDKLKKKLLEYKAGSKIGLENFTDAEQGEMDDFQIRIAIFGQTGTGKSALINTIYKVLLSPDELPEEGEVAIVQSAGGEGTSILEEFFQERGFTVVDTRGFFDIDNELEETEFFRILYGTVKQGEEIDRQDRGQSQTARAGKGGYRLNKPPISHQVHVVLWVIKGDDVRVLNEDYHQKLNFVLHRLGRESITLLTVITHSDRIDSSKVEEVISKSREATKSLACHTFLVHNWIAGMSRLNAETEENVLTMLDTALECGERSVKIRQTKRRAEEIKAEKLEREIERSKVRMPKENVEELERLSNKNVNVVFNKF